MSLTLALDHCIIVAATNTDDSHHDAVAGFLAAARECRARLVVSTGVQYDQEADQDDRRRQALRDWITANGIERIGGPFTFGHSRLGSGDVLLSTQQKETLDRIRPWAWPQGMPSEEAYVRRKYNDWFHYTAAVISEADGFITTDLRGVLPRLKRHNDELPVPILEPEEAAYVCRVAADSPPPN